MANFPRVLPHLAPPRSDIPDIDKFIREKLQQDEIFNKIKADGGAAGCDRSLDDLDTDAERPWGLPLLGGGEVLSRQEVDQVDMDQVFLGPKYTYRNSVAGAIIVGVLVVEISVFRRIFARKK